LEVVVETTVPRMLTVGPLFMALWPAGDHRHPVFPLSEEPWHR